MKKTPKPNILLNSIYNYLLKCIEIFSHLQIIPYTLKLFIKNGSVESPEKIMEIICFLFKYIAGKEVHTCAKNMKLISKEINFLEKCKFI